MDEKKIKKIIKNSKIMIATPMYGGNCSMHYFNGVLNFVALAYQIKLKFSIETLGNESLISRARNVITDKFMKSDCTHLMWIDADTHFKASDIIELLLLDKDACTGLVCKKSINWQNIKAALNENTFDKLTPDNLKTLGANFAFTGLKGDIDINNIFEIKHAGNAFLMIKKKVLEDYVKTYPHLEYTEYKTNNLNPEEIPDKKFAFFDTGIEKETNHYLSEDYFFSQNVRKMGYKIWACPSLVLGHVGTYNFEGNLPALSKLANFSSS